MTGTPAPPPAAGPAPEPALGPSWEPGPRRIFPDEQVWPPVPRPSRESPGSSTQPFPAVPAEPPPAAPVPASPAAAPAGAPSPEAGAVRTAPAPRRRTALRLGALLVAVALAVGIPSWEGYRFYRAGIPALHHHTVEPGGSGTLMHVSWQAGIERADSVPEFGEAGPGRAWLKITLTRTALDAEGLVRRGEPEVRLVHPDGRSWQTAIVGSDLPVEAAELRVGVPYRYEAAGLVPEEIADDVEVHVVPSTIRVPLRDESVAEQVGRAGTEKTEPRDQVLVFTR
ncbi:hypothetical protein GCM10010466_67590 [Planomonospora alba]|uniref:Uncharacterized protein n=1 Tax=Planomonospora alba TaxID=161354 RepID=A0ABP6P6X9_9ACTN